MVRKTPEAAATTGWNIEFRCPEENPAVRQWTKWWCHDLSQEQALQEWRILMDESSWPQVRDLRLVGPDGTTYFEHLHDPDSTTSSSPCHDGTVPLPADLELELLPSPTAHLGNATVSVVHNGRIVSFELEGLELSCTVQTDGSEHWYLGNGGKDFIGDQVEKALLQLHKEATGR